MFLMPKCDCCGGGGGLDCGGSVPVVDPLTVGQWIPTSNWTTNGPSVIFDSNARGKTWFFMGSPTTSNKNGNATIQEQQDWDNPCNWWSDRSVTPFAASWTVASFTGRAPTLPPDDATIFFNTTPRLNSPRTCSVAYFINTALQAGDTLTCTGTAHDAGGGGAVFHGQTAAWCHGTLIGGAMFNHYARLYGTLVGNGEWRNLSRIYENAVVNGNATAIAGSTVTWTGYVNSTKTISVTGDVTFASNGTATGVVVGGNLTQSAGTTQRFTVNGTTLLTNGGLSFSTLNQTLILYNNSSAVSMEDVVGTVTCFNTSRFSGNCQSSVTCWDYSYIQTPTSCQSVTLHGGSSLRYSSLGSVTCSGAFAAYDTAGTQAVTLNAGSATFSDTSTHGYYAGSTYSGGSISGDVTFNDSSKSYAGVTGTATFNTAAEMRAGTVANAVFNGNAKCAVTSAAAVTNSAVFNDNACTTYKATVSGVCPDLFTQYAKFWVTGSGGTQTCNGTALPWACPPNQPSCGCDARP